MKKSSPPTFIIAAVLGLLTALVAASFRHARYAVRPEADGYLFCFWNVENLFDDKQDAHPNPADRTFDAWFAQSAKDRELKLAHLSKALLDINQGRGPDILAIAEVESERAAELLRQRLNAHLPRSLHYQPALMKEVDGGRHIAPAILSRLPVDRKRTHLLDKRHRILEGHVHVNGHDLVILASHWTSRISDEAGHARAKYGDLIYGHFRQMYHSNPDVDLLVCGDFNDPPSAPSVTQHLHAVSPKDWRLRSNPPLLMDLFDGKDPRTWGTHFYHQWYIFDQIVIAPGLLDPRGWSCNPASVQTVKTPSRPRDKQQKPWRFGNPRDKASRGYSDHFPVTVRLKVQ